MTLEQTVKIPSDRWVNLRFEAPREIPTGTQVGFRIIPFPVKKRMSAEEEALSIANNIEFINEFMEGVLEDQNLDSEDSTK